VRLLGAADRYETVGLGILSRHCFSAGAHYDPENLSFGPLLGVDEHLIEPGAGFEEHAHRGVDIFSWIVAGELHHHDSLGADQVVPDGEPLVQHAGERITHSERNPSTTQALRLVQSTLIAGSGIELVAVSSSAAIQARWSHLFVVTGQWEVGDIELGVGDSLRAEEPLRVDGDGLLLILR
jgi:hypothetical protein